MSVQHPGSLGSPSLFQCLRYQRGDLAPLTSPGGSRPNIPTPRPLPSVPPQAISAPSPSPHGWPLSENSDAQVTNGAGRAWGVPSQTSSMEPLWSRSHCLASQHSMPPSRPGPKLILSCQSIQKALPAEGSVLMPGLRPALPPAVWPRAGPTLTLPCGEAS